MMDPSRRKLIVNTGIGVVVTILVTSVMGFLFNAPSTLKAYGDERWVTYSYYDRRELLKERGTLLSRVTNMKIDLKYAEGEVAKARLEEKISAAEQRLDEISMALSELKP